MNWRTSFLFGLNLGLSVALFGQMETYQYKRAISGISDQWHQIALPETIHEKVNPTFSDLRIYGITVEKDTIEAPYLLKIATSDTQRKSVDFKLLNTTYNKNGHYLTFELSSIAATNQLQLDFIQENFDWRIQLAGSQNQQDWFVIKENYRIIAIKNELTNYQFSTINFPTTKYKYYRLLVKTAQSVKLKKADLELQKTTTANYQDFLITNQQLSINPQQKTTVLAIDLVRPLPVSFLSFKVKNEFDFYRPMTIQYLKDSIQTKEGWKYRYQNLNQTVLSSLEPSAFTFKSTLTKKLKIIIQNQDNPPLLIDSISIKGYEHRLVARFTQPARYHLTYGRKNAPKPRYDIKQFEHKIPTTLSSLTLADEQVIPKIVEPVVKPFFENKIWLWGIMLGIIGVLGWFTLKMLQEKS